MAESEPADWDDAYSNGLRDPSGRRTRVNGDLASLAIDAGNPHIFEEDDIPYVQRPNDRRLAIHTIGKPTGPHVFLLQGTPGSRLYPIMRHISLYQYGISHITFDRPGFGGSDPMPGRTIADGVGDIEAVADALGIEEFAVVGRSGGGAYALEAKIRLGKRVRAAVVLGSMAPKSAQVQLAGLTPDNEQAYNETREELLESRGKLADKPNDFLSFIGQDFKEADLKVMQSAGMEALLKRSYRQGFIQGAEGWVEDIEAWKNWELSHVDHDPDILIWSGEEDPFSLTAQSEWLHYHIPGSTLITHPGLSHFATLPVAPLAFTWALARTKEHRQKVEYDMSQITDGFLTRGVNIRP